MNRILNGSSPIQLRWAAAIFAAVVILVSLVACRQDDESIPAETSTAPATQAAETEETPTSVPTLSRPGTDTAKPDEPTPKPEIISTAETTPPEIDCGEFLPILDEYPIEPVSSLRRSDVDLNSVPAAAQPALQRMLAAPGSVGLVAFEVGREDEGIYFNADTAKPLASVAKIINLVAYANAVEAGAIDPSTWVPVSEIESAYLPGSDLGAHRASLAELKEKGLITEDDPSIPMEQIPWMMMRHSSNSASDYLQTLIGQDVIENTIQELGLATHTAPCPFIGQFLAISNHTRLGNDRQAIESYLDEPERYGQEVMQLTEAFMTDPDFRGDEGYWRAPISSQRYFAEQLNSKASARDYAKLMAMISKNEIGSDFVNILVRRAIEWPMIYPVNQSLFSSVGYKNGSLPGVLNSAYYGTRLEDGAQLVVVLLYHDLPMQLYRQWRRSLPHDELARWILSDPNALEMMRSWVDSNS
jgi:D-alanyl-D-alanine carboxypeptidase